MCGVTENKNRRGGGGSNSCVTVVVDADCLWLRLCFTRGRNLCGRLRKRLEDADEVEQQNTSGSISIVPDLHKTFVIFISTEYIVRLVFSLHVSKQLSILCGPHVLVVVPPISLGLGVLAALLDDETRYTGPTSVCGNWTLWSPVDSCGPLVVSFGLTWFPVVFRGLPLSPAF